MVHTSKIAHHCHVTMQTFNRFVHRCTADQLLEAGPLFFASSLRTAIAIMTTGKYDFHLSCVMMSRLMDGGSSWLVVLLGVGSLRFSFL